MHSNYIFVGCVQPRHLNSIFSQVLNTQKLLKMFEGQIAFLCLRAH